MKITDQDVMRVADLARLRFSPGERAEMTVQLSRILKYFESLTDVDTEGLAPFAHDSHTADPLRADEAQPCMSLDDVLGNAPDRAKNLFKVPKSIEG